MRGPLLLVLVLAIGGWLLLWRTRRRARAPAAAGVQPQTIRRLELAARVLMLGSLVAGVLLSTARAPGERWQAIALSAAGGLFLGVLLPLAALRLQGPEAVQAYLAHLERLTHCSRRVLLVAWIVALLVLAALAFYGGVG